MYKAKAPCSAFCTLRTDYSNRTLSDLLRDALRPCRALAFEQMPKRETLKAYPELDKAYQTLQTAATCFESKMPGQPKTQAASIQAIIDRMQAGLNAGETNDFERSLEAAPKERQTQHQQIEPGQERLMTTFSPAASSCMGNLGS